MKQLFFRGGVPFVADVAPPSVEPGRVLIQVACSAVSPGTEIGSLSSSGRSFLSLALEKRHRVDRLIDALRRRDLDDLRARVTRLAARRENWVAVGYSAAGIVLAVGEGVTRFAPGDRVAAAGAGHASHAEMISVPQNLVASVPASLELELASTIALGAISLQAVRRAGTAIGETVVVLGLGLLGQIAARLLVASGARVLVWDPRAERMAAAAAHGAEALAVDRSADVPLAVRAATQGLGADQVLLAAGAGAESVAVAAESTRRAGVLVLLGATPVQMPREIAYERELNVRISTSYGPGRYDPRYEDAGQDYPIAWVRWTENRNMAAYLGLLAAGRIRIDDLLRRVHGLADAREIYASLQLPGSSPGVVFWYMTDTTAPAVVSSVTPPPHPTPPVGPSSPLLPRPPISPPLRIALLGTGAYVDASILPEFARLGDRVRVTLLSGSNPSRREPLAARFGIARTASVHEASAVDDDADLIVIATRHDRHADLTARAIRAGKAVLCEKPLALDAAGVAEIERALRETGGAPFLMVGFNRRFAPATLAVREALSPRRGPLQIVYRVQAGLLPAEHWIRGAEGGGRLIGEAVHMLDLLRAFSGAPLTRAAVLSGGGGPEGDPAADTFHLALGYADGSTASLLYTSRGSMRHPKEQIEIHADGRTFEIVDFQVARETGRETPLWQGPAPRKGQDGMWRAVIDALVGGGQAPIPIEELLETARAVIALEGARR